METTDIAILEQANVVVANEDGRLRAGEVRTIIKAERDRRFNDWDPMRATAYTTWQTIKKNMNTEIDPWDNALAQIDKGVSVYLTRIKNEQIAAQAKLDAIETERVRKERARLLALSVEAENKRKSLLVEAENTESEVEKAKLIEKAAKIEVKQVALEEKAEAVYEEPVFAEKYIPKKVTLSGGGSMGQKEDEEIIIVNEKEVYRQIANGTMPWICAPLVLIAIKRYAKANGKSGCDIPGILIRAVVKSTQRKG